MKKIVYFHQSAELYGSDKALLSLVSSLDRTKYTPVVLLPREGDLSEALRQSHVDVHVMPLTIMGRSCLRLNGMLRIPFDLLKSVFAVSKFMADSRVDMVQSNTLAVLTGAVWAKKKGIPHVWHVHEVAIKPKIVSLLLAWCLRILATRIVCNSKATESWLLECQPVLSQKTTLIWNGLERPFPVNKEATGSLRHELGLVNNDILIVLMGRINRLKGQALLIDAAEVLHLRGIKNVHYLMVGDPPPGQDYFKEILLSKIAVSPIKGQVTLVGFREDIWNVWDTCDIAVVPSTEPESFGMVALEAMAAQRPVVAAAHGGLLDVVVHGETGLLFEPGNVEALANALEVMVQDPDKRMEFGRRGAIRAKKLFSLDQYVRSFEQLYSDIHL